MHLNSKLLCLSPPQAVTPLEVTVLAGEKSIKLFDALDGGGSDDDDGNDNDDDNNNDGGEDEGMMMMIVMVMMMMLLMDMMG